MAEKLRTYNDLLKLIQDSEREYDLALIDKAYQLAYQMHGDQKRLSGAPYISHPIAVACILRFVQDCLADLYDPESHPALAAHSARAEALPVFQEISQPFIPPA